MKMVWAVFWFEMGAGAMGIFMLGMLFFHRPTQRRWARVWNRESHPKEQG